MASYCAGCGASQPAGARFCSACGKAVTEPGSVAPQPQAPLMRPIAGRKVAGVCRGLANQYGWDVTATRVITVLLAVLVFPVGLVVYLLFWLIMPQELQTSPPTTHLGNAV
jgi:phage shock protein C